MYKNSNLDSHHALDQNILSIMAFLLNYQPQQVKLAQYPDILKKFEALDLADSYVLFSLLEKQLPHRARMLFVGESYQGKRETILEVFEHITSQ